MIQWFRATEEINQSAPHGACMTTIRSIRLPDGIIKDLDEATAEDGYRSFNKLANHLIDEYLQPKRWKKTYVPSQSKTKYVTIAITPKVMRYIFQKDWDLSTGVPDDEDVIEGEVLQENFDELVKQGLLCEGDARGEPRTLDQLLFG